MLGEDMDKRGAYSMNENDKYEKDEYIREWLVNGIKFRLLTASKAWGSNICLGIDFKD